jgi:hypothetical protein
VTGALSRHFASGEAFAIPVYGLAITIALVTYNARNDQLYDELVDRAASIERTLDLADGFFANRPQPWLRIRVFGCKWTVDHRGSVSLIYTASIVFWLFLAFVPLVNLADQVFVNLADQVYRYFQLPHIRVADPVMWVKLISLAFALVITGLTAKSIIGQNDTRRREMRLLAKCAVDLVQSRGVTRISADCLVVLLHLCEKLSGLKPNVIRARARFYLEADPKTLALYLQAGSDDRAAAQFVALLTDLPPGWLLDCATNRRGNLAVYDSALAELLMAGPSEVQVH